MTPDFDGARSLARAQLWQVTIVALGIGAVVKLCCRNRPRLAYALWMLVVVKSIVPPYLSSPTGLFSWALAGRATAHTSFAENRRGPSVISRASDPHSGSSASAADIVEGGAKADSAVVWDHLDLAVTSIWVAGFVLSTAFVLAKQIACSSLIRRSSLPVDERYVSALAELSPTAGCEATRPSDRDLEADRPGGVRSGQAFDLDAGSFASWQLARAGRTGSGS